MNPFLTCYEPFSTSLASISDDRVSVRACCHVLQLLVMSKLAYRCLNQRSENVLSHIDGEFYCRGNVYPFEYSLKQLPANPIRTLDETMSPSVSICKIPASGPRWQFQLRRLVAVSISRKLASNQDEFLTERCLIFYSPSLSWKSEASHTVTWRQTSFLTSKCNCPVPGFV